MTRESNAIVTTSVFYQSSSTIAFQHFTVYMGFLSSTKNANYLAMLFIRITMASRSIPWTNNPEYFLIWNAFRTKEFARIMCFSAAAKQQRVHDFCSGNLPVVARYCLYTLCVALCVQHINNGKSRSCYDSLSLQNGYEKGSFHFHWVRYSW